jgi:hypothetical protein
METVVCGSPELGVTMLCAHFGVVRYYSFCPAQALMDCSVCAHVLALWRQHVCS